MSLSAGGSELNRATLDASASTGGIDPDVERSQATEDRVIHAIAITDTGGTANVAAEVSFSSSPSFGSSANDNTKASRIALSQMESFFDLSAAPIRWSAGEEIHVHTRNNAGQSEACYVTIYYTEG